MIQNVYSGLKRSRPDLEAILTQEHIKLGFYLEGEEDFIYLYDRESQRQGVFSSKGATVKAIREEVDRIIANRVY